MRIRNSRPEDLDRIMEIYAHARQFMAEHGNPRQWGGTNWPPERLIRQDIVTADHYIWMVDLASWIPVRESIYAFYLSEDPFHPDETADEQE